MLRIILAVTPTSAFGSHNTQVYKYKIFYPSNISVNLFNEEFFSRHSANNYIRNFHNRKTVLFPTIKNINTLLDQFGEKNSLIFIDNQNAADILPLHYPVVLRRLEPGILWRSSYDYNIGNYNMIWLPYNTFKNNRKISGNGRFIPCIFPTSPNFYRASFELK